MKNFLSVLPYMRLMPLLKNPLFLVSVQWTRITSGFSSCLAAQAVKGEISPYPFSLHRRVSSLSDHDMHAARLFSQG